MLLLDTPPPDRHSPIEDLQGIVIGAALVALSIQFLRAADLITGQIAGLALIASYGGGVSFGAAFFMMNLPFYLLAVCKFGWQFTAKSFAAVALMAAFTETLPYAVTISDISPALAAGLFGLCSGVGLLSLFRHGATLGGIGIVALWLQDRTGFRAGHTQLLFDFGIFAVACMFLPLGTVGWSLLGAVILNSIIATNHRRDRYIARP